MSPETRALMDEREEQKQVRAQMKQRMAEIRKEYLLRKKQGLVD